MRLIRFAVIALFALLFIVVALANRHGVLVSLDPIDGTAGPLAMGLPLYVIIFIAAFIGIGFGALVTWLGQGRHRRAAKTAKKQAAALHKEAMVPTSPPPAAQP